MKERSGLSKWVLKRDPFPDELRGRWELHMMERHFHFFYRTIMGAEYSVTPRQDDQTPPPMFDASKVPAAKTQSKLPASARNQIEVTWSLLEDDDGEQ